MKISEVVKNDDGSVSFHNELSVKETQAVLQFGMNMAMAMGILSQLFPGRQSLDDVVDESNPQ